MVFPGEAQETLSNNAMRTVVIRLGYVDGIKITVHGFRTTFRVWGGRQEEKTESGRVVNRYSNETLEFAIGHVVGSETQRAYDRDDYLAHRLGAGLGRLRDVGAY